MNGAVYVHVCIRPEGLVAGRWLCVNKPGEMLVYILLAVRWRKMNFLPEGAAEGSSCSTFSLPPPRGRRCLKYGKLLFFTSWKKRRDTAAPHLRKKGRGGRSMNLSWGMVSLSLREHLAKWGMQKSATQMCSRIVKPKVVKLQHFRLGGGLLASSCI